VAYFLLFADYFAVWGLDMGRFVLWTALRPAGSKVRLFEPDFIPRAEAGHFGAPSSTAVISAYVSFANLEHPRNVGTLGIVEEFKKDRLGA
jgi:hypothetical protein